MRELAVPSFTFFVGKGGVGKTTVSSSFALHRAAQSPRRRVLLISSDPAHSLSDALEVKLGARPTRLRTTGKLWAAQIDPEWQIKRFLKTERGDILDLLSKGSLFQREELEPLLDTALPGMAEVAALLAIHDLIDSDFDDIVIDTAPMGHAIRLFQMPEHFARFLNVLKAAAARDQVLAQRFGGRIPAQPSVERWARMVGHVEAALAAEGSEIMMVTTPEPFSLKQAARSAAMFEDQQEKQRISAVVLNRVVSYPADCPACTRRASETRKAATFLTKNFKGARILHAEDPGSPIFGLVKLRAFGAHVFSGRPLPKAVVTHAPKAAAMKLAALSWPELSAPLTLTVGKGGVGKTTISAGLAFHQRELQKRGAKDSRHKNAVAICSVDPAPSLDDIFEQKVEDRLIPVLGDRSFCAAELDAGREFARWADQLRSRISAATSSEQRGLHVDLTLDRDFLLSLLDVVPPGIDEVFAVFRILDLLDEGGPVVIDMAPTGHALEVLATPARLLAWSRLLLKTLAAHRTLPFAQDAAVDLATMAQRVRDLSAMLQDARRCSVLVVTLAEPLPDRETIRLLRSLKDLRVPVARVFVNRVRLESDTRSSRGSTRREKCPRCRSSREWQRYVLAEMQRQLRGKQIYVVPEFSAQIMGAKALQRLTRRLWQIRKAPERK